jgi:hypothetical protein
MKTPVPFCAKFEEKSVKRKKKDKNLDYCFSYIIALASLVLEMNVNRP